jgi:hypothetical protein
VGDAEGDAPPARSRSRKFSVHSRHLLGFLLLAGAIVFSPALRSHYLLDDYLHASMVAGAYPAPRGPFDLYNFVTDADRAILLDRGMLPWWSDPRLTIRFFRPLSSALVWLEHRALGPLEGHTLGTRLLHFHSFLWWGAVVLVAHAFFRRLLARRPARIATVVFALAPCHALPLGWLANREVLVSLAFGIPGLTVYLRWRGALRPDGEGGGSSGGRLRDAALAALLFGLAMLGGEYAICLAGYIVAFEATREPFGRFWQRVAGMLPFAVPTVAYLALRRSLGCGTLGSGFYADPIREPRTFLAYVPRRLTTLLLDEWFSLDHQTLIPQTQWWLLALIGLAAAVIVLLPLRRVLARLDEPQRRVAEWLAPGSVLALAPVLAVVPSPRVLGASMLGAAAVVAWLLDHAWFSERAPTGRGDERIGFAALVVGFAQLVHAPMTGWLIGRYYQDEADTFLEHTSALRARMEDPANTELVVARAIASAFFLPFAIDPHGVPPARWRVLSQTGHVLAIRRDDRTLDLIVPATQSIFPAASGNLFRSEQSKLSVGEVFTVPGLRATVLDMGDTGPRAVRIELDRPLDDPPYFWISDTTRGFLDATPPAEGFGKPLDP